MTAEQRVIRAARVAEAELLSDLALRSKALWGYTPEFLEACRSELSYDQEQLSAADVQFFVLECAGAVVGFYALSCLGQESAELEALFVEPRCIGCGFGRLLVDHAKSVAAATNARQLVIQGDPNAAGFYRAVGAVRGGVRESASIPGRFLPVFVIPLIRG